MAAISATITALRTARKAKKATKKIREPKGKGSPNFLKRLWENSRASVVSVLVCVIIASYLVGAVVMGTLSTMAHFATLGVRNNVCAAEVTGGQPGDNDQHGGDNAGEEWGTAGTPWPKQDSNTVVYPVPSPALTSGWGPRAPMNVGGVLTPGYHNGLDFGQGMGTPVLSMADGVVATSAAGTSLYGSHVAVKHKINGSEYTSVYGHIIGSSIKVKKGDTVKAGQQIASVGSEGMSTAPHLHFVLTMGNYAPSVSEPGWVGGKGNTIDPASFLKTNGAVNAGGGIEGDDFSGVDSTGVECLGATDDGLLDGDGFGSWGGHENGKITEIRKLNFDGSKWLYSPAATQMEELNKAYRTEFGKNITVLRGYESVETQASKGDLVGKSQYGWARAVKLDLKFDTAEYEWMNANAKTYGWNQPSVYQRGGSTAHAGMWGFVGVASSIPPASSPEAEKARKFAKSYMVTNYSWGNSEYACIVNLWERESNWNPTADNPTSDAYGIPQALPGEKMATAGTDWKTNGDTQVKWGLSYVAERYGTPCEAWAFWQETDPSKKSGIPGNWY